MDIMDDVGVAPIIALRPSDEKVITVNRTECWWVLEHTCPSEWSGFEQCSWWYVSWSGSYDNAKDDFEKIQYWIVMMLLDFKTG